MGGVYGRSKSTEIHVLIATDKATYVRERQSGRSVGGEHAHDMIHKGGGASRPLHRNILKPCNVRVLTLRFNDKTLPAVSVPL